MRVPITARIYLAIFKMMDGRTKYTFEDITYLLNKTKKFQLAPNCEYVHNALTGLVVAEIVEKIDNKYKITKLGRMMRK
jgi:hypothetical protein